MYSLQAYLGVLVSDLLYCPWCRDWYPRGTNHTCLGKKEYLRQEKLLESCSHEQAFKIPGKKRWTCNGCGVDLPQPPQKPQTDS